VTYDVVVGADNEQFLLKPGMTATVSIVTDRREQVLRVPNQALRFSPGGLRSASAQPGAPEAAAGAGAKAQVWVLRAGKPLPVGITTGLADDTYTEVRAGALRAGEQVVIGEQRVTGGSRTPGLHFGS